MGALRNGLAYPIASAGLLGTWTVGRILYINGYGSGNPDKRMLGGAVSHLADLPLIVMAFFSAHKASRSGRHAHLRIITTPP